MKPLTGNVGGALSSRVLPSPLLVRPRTDLECWTLGIRRSNPRVKHNVDGLPNR